MFMPNLVSNLIQLDVDDDTCMFCVVQGGGSNNPPPPGPSVH